MQPAGDRPTLSVVMPAYNEHAGIQEAIADVVGNVFSLVGDVELVVVDDGSTDTTGAVLDRLAAADTRIRVIHRANGGHGAALRTALDAARGQYLLLIDADHQIPMDGFGAYWAAVQDCDAVLGVRARRFDPGYRLVLTRWVARSVRLLLGVSARDANVPFKLVRATAWRDAAAYIPPLTLTPSLFLAVFLKRCGYRVVEMEVKHRARPSGESTLRHLRLARFCMHAGWQMLLFAIRLRGAPPAVPR